MEMTRLLHQLDNRMLGEMFSEDTIVRGSQYVSRVGDIEVQGSTLRALVRGSRPQPYQVTVRLERREYFGELTLEVATRCSCPVGNRCKHAVGLLLAAKKQGDDLDADDLPDADGDDALAADDLDDDEDDIEVEVEVDDKGEGDR